MSPQLDRSIVGTEFDRTACGPITEDEIREYSAASGEPLPPSESGAVIAPPTFVVRLRGKHFMPPNLPPLGDAAFDAGKDIEFGSAPVCAGDVLTIVNTVHDLYEKTGRSGTMGFLVLRAVVTNQRDETVAIIDQKMMFR